MIEHTVLPCANHTGGFETATIAAAINVHGMVAGHVHVPAAIGRGHGSYHAAVWHVDDVTDIGTLAPHDALQRAFAEDLNDAGAVVGWGTISRAGPPLLCGFVWEAGGMRPLPPLVPGRDAQARAIDARGRIGGTACDPSGVNRAVVWETPDAPPTDLGVPGTVVAMNAAGEMVGSSGSRAFLWTAERGAIMLGTLGGRFAAAHAINTQGQVVGVAPSSDGTSRPFLWTRERGMRSLGLPPSCIGAAAYAINDRGAIAVAGHVRDRVQDLISSRAWLYVDGEWIELGPEEHSTAAVDVNDALQVVGIAASRDSSILRAIRWDAAPQISSPLPA